MLIICIQLFAYKIYKYIIRGINISIIDFENLVKSKNLRILVKYNKILLLLPNLYNYEDISI